LICLLVITTAFFARLAPASSTQVTASTEPSSPASIDRLRALQTERYDTLKKIVESMRPFFEAGRLDLTDIRDAKVAVLRAEADLCATPAERVKVYEKIVDLQRTYEADMARKAASGRAGQWEADKAKVATLEAQIVLEKLRLEQHH
jgi:outer membrane protein TolC